MMFLLIVPQILRYSVSTLSLFSFLVSIDSFQESRFFFGAAADLPVSISSLALSTANRYADHGIVHAPSRITRGHVHSVRVMRARAAARAVGETQASRADASITLARKRDRDR